MITTECGHCSKTIFKAEKRDQEESQAHFTENGKAINVPLESVRFCATTT